MSICSGVSNISNQHAFFVWQKCFTYPHPEVPDAALLYMLPAPVRRGLYPLTYYRNQQELIRMASNLVNFCRTIWGDVFGYGKQANRHGHVASLRPKRNLRKPDRLIDSMPELPRKRTTSIQKKSPRPAKKRPRRHRNYNRDLKWTQDDGEYDSEEIVLAPRRRKAARTVSKRK